MSASESNLQSVGYDMVVGLTQNAMNATMERFLDSLPSDEISPTCYLYKDSSANEVELVDYDDLLEMTGGVDPFSLPVGTYSNTDADLDPDTLAAMNALASVLFAYGFQSTMGLPASNNLPDIMTLQNGTEYQQVKYNMYFATFNIVELVPGFGDLSITHTVQDPNDPWIYQYVVNLDLQSSDYSSSDSKVPDDVVNLSSASMYSIQQLMLDLTTAPVISATQPAVYTQFDANSLFQEYLQKYFDALNRHEANIFAQAVQPIDSAETSEPTLVPTGLDFMVSPYVDDASDGSLTEEESQGLWTLNYLVMADNNALPNPVVDPSPTWNWINASENQNYSGIMTIRKGAFVEYLKATLDPALSQVCIYPNIIINDDNNLVTTQWYSESNPAYTTENVNTNNTSTHVLTHSFGPNTKSDTADADWYKAEVSTTTTSDVYISGTTIEIDTKITVYTNFYAGYITGDTSLSETSGYVYAKTNRMVYDISVTTDGKLSVSENTDLSGNTNLLGTSGYDEPDPSFWSDLLSGWKEEDWSTDLTSDLDTAINGYLSDYDAHMTDLLNNVNAWVFPGTDTFTFSQSNFSDYQDLTSYVKYTDVS